MNEHIGLGLVCVGLALNMAGALALVRLPDAVARLGAAVKCVSLGACTMLTGTLFLHGLYAGMTAAPALALIAVGAPLAVNAVIGAAGPSQSDVEGDKGLESGGPEE